MVRAWFSSPVRIEGPAPGVAVNVSSLEEAARRLLERDENEWLPTWRPAVSQCLAAMEGRLTVEEAREAFIVAMREADLLVGGGYFGTEPLRTYLMRLGPSPGIVVDPV